MNPSAEQQAILDAADHQRHMMVSAMPGSGKTATAVMLMQRLKGRTAYFPFNKSTAEEMAKKVPPGIAVATLNSAGRRILMGAFPQTRHEPDRTKLVAQQFIHDPKIIAAVTRLISLKKATLKTTEELIKEHEITTDDEKTFLEVAQATWKIVSRPGRESDFDDQVFIPVVTKIVHKTYDTVVVDEAQDLSPVQIKFVLAIAHRVIAIGDPNQAIYQFRGADPDSMDKIREALNPELFQLSTCYRCPTSVVAEAAKLVPGIKAAPNAIPGEVKHVSKFEPTTTSVVLCRKTAPLLKHCLRLLVQGQPAHVKGREIGDQLTGLINKLASHTAIPITDFIQALQAYRVKEIARLEALQRTTEPLVDRCDALDALTEGASIVQDLIDRINNVFSLGSGTTFMTIHKAKGLEALDVWIITTPPIKTTNPKAAKQEVNMEFVAITRSLRTLTFFSEKQL